MAASIPDVRTLRRLALEGCDARHKSSIFATADDSRHHFGTAGSGRLSVTVTRQRPSLVLLTS
jgi:hypothetical protein